MKQFGKNYLDPMKFWLDFDVPMPKRMQHFLDEFSKPFVDSFETEDEIVVTAELPGVKKDDLKVKVDDTGLSIKVEEKSKHEEEKKEKGSYYHAFSTRFKGYDEYIGFSSKVDASKAKASFKNGVLEVRVPKLEKAKGRELKID